MKQLTINEVTPYLPYELKVLTNSGIEKVLSTVGVSNVTLEYDFDIYSYDKFKPILRNLSDLTKEIEHNRERFVPIERLKENLSRDWCDSFDEYLDFIHDACYSSNAILQGSYKIIQKLLEWHFDIFSLIENGLAVDINTLNK